MVETQDVKPLTRVQSESGSRSTLHKLSSKVKAFRPASIFLKNLRLREENARLLSEKQGKRRAVSDETSKKKSGSTDAANWVLVCPGVDPDDMVLPQLESIQIARSSNETPSSNSSSKKATKKRERHKLRHIQERPRVGERVAPMRPISAPFNARLFSEEARPLTADELEKAYGRSGPPKCATCEVHCGEASGSSNNSRPSSARGSSSANDEQTA